VKKYKIKSFSKINLSLRVLSRLNSGYHNINSIITFCNLHDVISIYKINGSNDKISFSGRFKKGINGKSNTVTKLLNLLRKKNFLKKQAFKINIQKNIPHGSGLGGGSSNAADLLNFFNKNMYLKLNNNELNKIANQIGFDVPISLEKKNTLLIGKKGKMLKLNQKFRLNIVIVYPNIVCSTKKIYNKNKKYTQPMSQTYFYKKKLVDCLKSEKNDLEKIVTGLYPRVRKIINFIKFQHGCYFSRITGSGSACIGMFSNTKSAIFTQKLIKLKFPKYWCIVSKTI
tara:strand:- start:359 stop:1213 length:855 start_codon:yes stop_codon:yes gene_type:complete